LEVIPGGISPKSHEKAGGDEDEADEDEVVVVVKPRRLRE
jgi:hypothetical protein